jgi:crotonobetainyl-CoA:carnitine CoA-transferase CaiB-like acyl-CoA transferase
VPAGRVLSVPEILGHPHLTGRNFVSEFEGVTGKQKVTRGGFLFSDDQASPQGPAPALSEHTEKWLGKLGYDREKIKDLVKKRVI